MTPMPTDVDGAGPGRSPAPRSPRRPGSRRRPWASAVAVLAVTAAAGGLAGCGGQAQDVRDALTYTGDVNRVQQGFERDLRDLRLAADRAEVPADVERAVRRLGRSVTGVQADLRRIRPPGPVVGLHRDLIAAFARWDAPLRRFGRALGTRRSARGLRVARDVFVRETATVERGLSVAARRINDRLRRLSD